VLLLFFTAFVGQHGKQVLLEHHAFLLPVPEAARIKEKILAF
jgi:hypothetical protein